MTIIAYRNGIMAGDSCWSDDKRGLVETLTNKVFKLPGGSLYGASGCPDDRVLLARLSDVKVEKDFPSCKWLVKALDPDVLAIVVLPSGAVFFIGTGKGAGGVMPCDLPYTAVGEGRHLGIGAMAYGATAYEAVEVACAHNIFCRAPIHMVSLETLHARPHNRNRKSR